MEIVLNRIILFGSEINKLVKFYQDHFHFEVIEQDQDQWAVLRAGQIEIAFHKIGAHFIENNKPFKVDNNVKLVVEITGDLKKLRQELLDKNVQLNEIKSFEGINELLCDGQDPEGNKFQLRQQLKAA